MQVKKKKKREQNLQFHITNSRDSSLKKLTVGPMWLAKHDTLKIIAS
jgi:hypothetical protein